MKDRTGAGERHDGSVEDALRPHNREEEGGLVGGFQAQLDIIFFCFPSPFGALGTYGNLI